MTKPRADNAAMHERQRTHSYMMRVELFLSYMEDFEVLMDEVVAGKQQVDALFVTQWNNLKKKFDALREE